MEIKSCHCVFWSDFLPDNGRLKVLVQVGSRKEFSSSRS